MMNKEKKMSIITLAVILYGVYKVIKYLVRAQRIGHVLRSNINILGE